MSRYAYSLVTLFALVNLSTGVASHAATWQVQKTTHYTYVSPSPEGTGVTQVSGNKATYSQIQATPQYDVRRPEVPSGSRLTLFANFLGTAPGCVMFNVGGTSSRCEIVEWKNESVTIEIPHLGLVQPKNAEVAIILPDGRIGKVFRVVLVAQPDIMIHSESVPKPMPPAPASESASYSVSVPGGLTMYSGSQCD